MKKIALTCLALFSVAAIHAQVEDEWAKKMRESQQNAKKEFEQFKQNAYQSYEDFRRQANEDYARFMEEAWKNYETQPAEKAPEKPKPPQPIIDTDPIVSPQPVVPNPIRVPDPIVTPTLPVPDQTTLNKRPQPIEPIKPNPIPPAATQTANLYGTTFLFHHEKGNTYRLADISEKSVAKMWKELSGEDYDNVIAECLQQRDKSNLCDWAYVKLTQSVAESLFGKKSNEAVVMQMYLLTQSGYQVRIGRVENRLALLIGTTEILYGYESYRSDGQRFYIIDKSIKTKSKGIELFDHAFPNETSLSFQLTQPDLAVVKTAKRTLTSTRYPELKVVVETNQNLIDFYNDYPLNSRWENYSKASMSQTLKSSLYPTLRKAIEGKSELEAANILLNFVQTGFEYAKDDEQFGYERPLFCDETFYYPACDCEDRSILFTCLVRELMGLEVVLLDYPTHIAAAICFKEDVSGDYLMLDGKKFIISDPTFINAPVGKCAPKFKTISPNIVRF